MKLFILLGYPFFYQIRRLLFKDLSKPLYEVFTSFIGYLLALFFYSIQKHLSKPENQSENNKNLKNKKNENLNINRESFDAFEQIYLNAQINITWKYINLIILSIINLVPMCLEAYTNEYIKNKLEFKTNSSLFYYIFFFILFSKLIIKQELGSHQIFSIILIALSMIILLIFYILEEGFNDVGSHLLISLYLLIIMCFYSLYNVLEKNYYNKYFDSPYHFMSIVGLFSLIVISIYEIITDLIFGIDTSFNGILFQIKEYIKENGFLLFLLFFIIDIVTAFLWLLFITLTIYDFTPCHFIISEIISQIATTIINLYILDNYDIIIKIFIFILYGFILFASLVYNEVIIINIEKLNKNTKISMDAEESRERNEILDEIEEREDERQRN